MRLSGKCEKCTCSMRAVENMRVPNNPKRGVKGNRELSQLMERCDGYEG